MAEAANQFFSFDPKILLVDVRIAVVDYIADACDAIEKDLLDIFGKEYAQEVSSGTDELNNTLKEKFGEKFSLLEEYSERNIFKVDDDLAAAAATASNDEGTSAEDEAAVDAQLKELREKLTKAKKEEASLRVRDDQIAKLEKLFDRHREEIDKIKVGLGTTAAMFAAFQNPNHSIIPFC